MKKLIRKKMLYYVSEIKNKENKPNKDKPRDIEGDLHLLLTGRDREEQ